VPKRGKRLVTVLDQVDKMDHQYTKVLPKLHKLMNTIRSSIISTDKEKDYSFVEGMVKDIEQNNWKATPSDLKMCNKLYNIYKTPGTGYVRGRHEDAGLGMDEI